RFLDIEASGPSAEHKQTGRSSIVARQDPCQAGTIGRRPGTIRTGDELTIEYCLPCCTLCMMSDPGSDFRLYHSNSLDVLAALLARNVRA
ncbi:exodeoxyribonuclease V subunit gamma, partial [Salmonella enterica]|nr:exodeoxyribonuclease V subunit gamma [Salmonella enterica]